MSAADSMWWRELPLGGPPAPERVERWRRRTADRGEDTFEVDVRIGKPFDVLGIKGGDLEETRAYTRFLAETAQTLLDAPLGLRRVAACPACLASTEDAPQAFTVFGFNYHRCKACGHGFVRDRVPPATQNTVFETSDGHSSAYIDSAAAERRIAQIILPKLEWALGVADKHLARRPRTALDIGAGGGHFVAGARRAGLVTEGIEISAASRKFAQEAFGITLASEDFLTRTPQPVDLVTMWGLLEYVDEPRRFIEAARRSIAPGGMLVVEVPRYDALGTAVQSANPAGIARHMDPTSHVNCFSDASLMTLLHDHGFRPVAAWYFGMDAYEMLVQVALVSGRDAVLSACADLIPAIQAAADTALLCDDIVVAALPA